MPAIAAKPYETKTLGAAVDAVAPDGTAVRLLLSLAGGSMAHFELPAAAVSHAVTHRTVEEIWFVLTGRGSIWRRQDGLERTDPLAPGTSLTVPLGTAFQFRAEAGSPLDFRGNHHAALAWHGRGPARAWPVDADRGSRRLRLKARPCAQLGSLIAHGRRNAGLAQLVEQRFCKPWVGGSSPSTGTNQSSPYLDIRQSFQRGVRLRGMRGLFCV